jgi:division protein CdvB (Snf7/Vps24/ESCRT-III family)
MLAIDVLATKEPEVDVLDLLKKEKSMAQAEHHACANAIQASQQATASKVEATIKAVEEAEKVAEMALKEMLFRLGLKSMMSNKIFLLLKPSLLYLKNQL